MSAGSASASSCRNLPGRVAFPKWWREDGRMATTATYYPTRDEVSDLMDRAEQVWGGFDRAYDECPEYRAMLRSAIGSMGCAEGFAALQRVLGS